MGKKSRLKKEFRQVIAGAGGEGLYGCRNHGMNGVLMMIATSPEDAARQYRENSGRMPDVVQQRIGDSLIDHPVPGKVLAS